MNISLVLGTSLVLVGGIFYIMQNKESDIPTSSVRENISLPKESKIQNRVKDNNDEDLNDMPPQIPASIVNHKSQVENQYKDEDEIRDEVKSENDIESEVANEEQNRENEQNSSSSVNKQLTDEEVEAEIQKAMAKYPRPPVPVDLVPYDERDKNSYRLPTETESQNGVGDMPPVPPTMLIQNQK